MGGTSVPAAGAAIVLLGAAVASGEPDGERAPWLEVGALLGGEGFHSSDDPSSDEPRSRSGPLFGARVGVHATCWLGIEAELGVAPTEAAGDPVTLIGWRLHGVAYLPPAGLANGTVRPFYIVGAGAIATSNTGAAYQGDEEILIPLMGTDHDFVVDAGMGMAYLATPRLGFRFEARAVMTPRLRDRFDTPDLEVMVSAFLRFGGTSTRPAPPPPATPPPTSDQPDPAATEPESSPPLGESGTSEEPSAAEE